MEEKKPQGTASFQATPKTHGEKAKEKASEATQAAKESAVEARKAKKDTLTDVGASTAHATSEAATTVTDAGRSAADRTIEAKTAASEYAHIAAEKTTEVAAAAKETLTEAGGTVQSSLQAAIGFIKEHLPRVEHEEESEEEKRAKALLGETMGRPVDRDLGVSGEGAGAAVVEKKGDVGEGAQAEAVQAQAQAQAQVQETKEEAQAQAKRDEHRFAERMARTADSALSAPVTIREKLMEMRGEGGKGLGLGEKIHEAKEYVRHHSGGGGSGGGGGGTVHEYSALPGDIHVPLIATAVRIPTDVLKLPSNYYPIYREHVLHCPGEHGSTGHPSTTTTTPVLSTERERVMADARRRAEEATKTAEAQAAHVASIESSSIEKAYHAIADPIAEAMHSVEDKAAWAFEHTKDELLHKSAAETHREMRPRDEVEAAFAHGEIPLSTDVILGAEGHGVAPTTPSRIGGCDGGEEKEKEAKDAVTKSVVRYGGGENLGPTDAEDAVKAAMTAPPASSQ